MGNKDSKIKKKLFKKLKIKENKLVEEIICPFCNKKFDGSKLSFMNSHIKSCIKPKIKINSCILYPPSFDYDLNQIIFNNILEYEKNEPNNFINKTIEDKINELKAEIKKKKELDKIPFSMHLNRENLLEDTLKNTKTIINLYRDWRIYYKAEEGIDAGGLLRDFFSNIFEILEGEKLKLFITGESSDFSYILNPLLMQNEENFKYCRLIGLLLAKAIIQNITINICFNKLMYKLILCEKMEFDDLIFIDSQLYNSLKNLKENMEYGNEIENENNNDIIKELGLDYSIEMKDCYNHMHSFELIKNGRNITVENLDDLIQKRINFLIGIYEPFIKEIRNSFYKHLPIDKIKCLNSNELELVLNGRPFIDVEEWKSFTDYKGQYNADHIVIQWFWEILSGLSQKELSNLLLFATGSTRVPLGGFAELSNNGNLSRFTIEYIAYNNKIRNFIKSHTCFNRIDLPCYPNKNELKEAIKFVSENQMWGFGIE
jgi:hypothetical protein